MNRRVRNFVWSLMVGFGAIVPSLSAASGYLTGISSGVTVTGYMMNDGTGGSGYGMTLFVSGISNPDGCGGTDKVYIPGTDPDFNGLAAAVMAAVASGEQVGFWSSGCALMPFWGGTVTYPVIVTLWVVP